MCKRDIKSNLGTEPSEEYEEERKRHRCNTRIIAHGPYAGHAFVVPATYQLLTDDKVCGPLIEIDLAYQLIVRRSLYLYLLLTNQDRARAAALINK